MPGRSTWATVLFPAGVSKENKMYISCGDAYVPMTSWDPSGANAMPAMQRRSSGSASALTLTACRTSIVRVSMMLNVSECCVEKQIIMRAKTGPN